MNRVSGQVNPVGPYTEDETQQVSGWSLAILN